MIEGNALIYHLPGQLHGTVNSTNVTVSGGPTLLPADALADRKYLHIQNNSGASIYIGGPDVTTAAGIEIADDEEFKLHIGRAQVYATNAVSASGIVVLEIS